MCVGNAHRAEIEEKVGIENTLGTLAKPRTPAETTAKMKDSLHIFQGDYRDVCDSKIKRCGVL